MTPHNNMTINRHDEITMLKIHPGEILQKEFIASMGMTPHALSLTLGVPASRIADIIHGRRGITADTAARLGKYFGTSAQIWLNLQNRYDA